MRSPSRTMAFIAGALSVLAATTFAQNGMQRFPDVLRNTYFSEAIERFARMGIISGYEDGRFGPHDYVTRGQVAVIVDRYDQHVIKLLREQVQQMRAELGLGVCGDAVVQVGEECDDGNASDGDGCSAQCIQERICTGGYKVGDTFTASDGCNVCHCTEFGISCTKNICLQKKCFSSADCTSGEICSVEQGDCRFPCPKGAVCIQACAGVCLAEPAMPSCGNGICEAEETANVDRSGAKTFCPLDCSQTQPLCGNGVCDDGEADEFTLECTGSQTPCVAQPVLVNRGACPTDCEADLSLCEQRERVVNNLFEKKRTCAADVDCTVFVRSCSPYHTCGKSVNRNAILEVTTAVLEYISECRGEGPPECTPCLPNVAACIEGLCVVREAEGT